MSKQAKSTQTPVTYRTQLRPGLRRNQRHKTDCEEMIAQNNKTTPEIQV